MCWHGVVYYYVAGTFKAKCDEDWIARKIVHMEKTVWYNNVSMNWKLYCIVLYSGEWKIYWRCICMCRSLYPQFRVYYLVTIKLPVYITVIRCWFVHLVQFTRAVDPEKSIGWIFGSICWLAWKIQIACYMAVVGGCVPAWCVCTSWGTIYY